MIGVIAALDRARLIGKNGTLPWHYPADLKRFRRLTVGHTVVMGRKTWASLPKKPLAKRHNLVLTSTSIEGVDCFTDLESALAASSGDVWIIGGARLFAEAVEVADVVDLTWIPGEIPVERGDDAVYFPVLDDAVWESTSRRPLSEDLRLINERFERRAITG